ncbi:MAG TPA: PhzF family phenazine biosynthesis protein [Novosphingobium sp.]
MQIDLLDVFATGPLSGNPLAVVRGGEGLDTAAMQALTRWLGFSETTFLLPPVDPAADYRVRIFFPAGGVPREPGVVMQECGVGLVPVRVEADRLAFRAPPLRRAGPLDPAERAGAIRLAGVAQSAVLRAVHADNGPPWVLLHCVSAEAVLAAAPLAKAEGPVNIGLIGPHGPGGSVDWEVRAFFNNPRGGIEEDPVTGSFNAAAAQYLFAAGLAAGGYVAAQGGRTGADGRVYVTQDQDGAAWIGGVVRMVAAGGAMAG